MATRKPAPAPAGAKPTRARHLAIVFAVPLAVATYVDRVCISPVAPLMGRDLGPSPVRMGYAFAAFARSGAPFEVSGEWLGD
jgi:hypothetical protein